MSRQQQELNRRAKLPIGERLALLEQESNSRRGLTGEQGPAGAEGPQGPRGATGPEGKRGPVYERGPVEKLEDRRSDLITLAKARLTVMQLETDPVKRDKLSTEAALAQLKIEAITRELAEMSLD